MQPTTAGLQLGYPTDSPNMSNNGYDSYYQWTVQDNCGNADSGLDQNEVFGTWGYDYASENWAPPGQTHFNTGTSTVIDYLGGGNTVPQSEVPQTPLLTRKVFHDTYWQLFVGSISFGSGANIRSDTQQWYVDHGRHY
jgi:hypothetical protein